ncbi:MAG: hypothetical protein KF852_13495 [Saprospiraceae bacterium]|nr:hypothetical protein [Saprospiraceae bacterium]
MNLIDMDALELAAKYIIVDDVDGSIQIGEDPSRQPDTTKSGGMLKVQLKKNGSGMLIGTAIIHWTEIDSLADFLENQ